MTLANTMPQLYSMSQPDYLLALEQARDLAGPANIGSTTGTGPTTGDTLKLVVKRGMRVKIECQTDLARPHAEVSTLTYRRYTLDTSLP